MPCSFYGMLPHGETTKVGGESRRVGPSTNESRKEMYSVNGLVGYNLRGCSNLEIKHQDTLALS